MTTNPRVVVVTGAAQGIGRSIAEAFRRAGDAVVIADFNEFTGAETARETGADFVQIDIADRDQVDAFVPAVEALHPRIDVLVNAAGIAHETPAIDVSRETWDKVMSINLQGTWELCQQVGRHMISHGGGVIVNVASISGVIANTPEVHVAYDVSKAGVIHLTRSLGVEWAPHGVRVNAVAPSRTKTPILDSVGTSNPGRLEEWLAQVPQGRLLEPAEIAAPVEFLCSAGASAITGQTLIIDGGQTSC